MLVQKLRVQRGWSQEQLAELAGISVRTVQRIERGRRANPESLKALGAVFEIDFSRLQETAMSDPKSADLPTEEALALARVRKVKEFWVHLIQFVVLMPMFVIGNLLTTPDQLWCLWVLLAWGPAVGLHALAVFNRISFLDGAWERREVEKLLGRRL
ncbi:helix-turn-helix domain-containing protein [Phenylobacterium sp.]|jgi:transcriptional regulator with XRE-family HTH domain|uniref:helix-turn-helix domain-containing protein n=1 Tax=Phenylobacterium sp. TaxID=1871053 RepID=UPI002F927CA8